MEQCRQWKLQTASGGAAKTERVQKPSINKKERRGCEQHTRTHTRTNQNKKKKRAVAFGLLFWFDLKGRGVSLEHRHCCCCGQEKRTRDDIKSVLVRLRCGVRVGDGDEHTKADKKHNTSALPFHGWLVDTMLGVR